MKNVLIISGHTNLAASVANKTILETLNERLPEAEIVKLDELYPDFKIDVEAEQQKLLRADIIVLQFPLFWYSAPSILERWMEETFRHGFSHGSTGDKLKGKKLVLSFTTGAPEALYSHKGAMGYTIVPATLIEVSLTLASCFFILAISGVKATNPFIVPKYNRLFWGE